MTDKFDWDTEDKIVRETRDTVAYLNPEGEVVIRQRGDLYQEGSIVVIPIHSVYKLINRLEELLTEGEK